MDIVKPHQQVDQRGFAGPGGSNDGHLLPMVDRHTEIPDERRLRLVGKVDLTKLDVAADLLREVAVDRRLLRRIQHLIHTAGGRTGALQ